MGRKQTDAGLAKRAFSEIINKFGSVESAVQVLGITKTPIYSWGNGIHTPDAWALKQMAEHGMDVYYVLTGERRHD